MGCAGPRRSLGLAGASSGCGAGLFHLTVPFCPSALVLCVVGAVSPVCIPAGGREEEGSRGVALMTRTHRF